MKKVSFGGKPHSSGALPNADSWVQNREIEAKEADQAAHNRRAAESS